MEIDPDKVDGRGPLGWLIHTGAGTMVGSAPYSLWLTVDVILNPRPGDMNEAMLEGILPLVSCLPVAALGALGIVLAARAGRPLGVGALLALGAVLGVLAALIIAGSAPLSLVFGAASGLLAAGAIWKVRDQVLST